jgi:uncharacterized protein YndB with AHSA1/START domain
MNRLGTIARSNDGGFVLHYERTLGCAAAKAWAALTDPAFARNWIGELEVEPWVGGKFVIRFKDGKTVMTGVIRALEPERLIQYTWLENYGMPPSLVRWTVLPIDANTCHLTLTHVLPPGCKAEDIISFAGGWHGFLDLIPRAANGEDASEGAYDEAAWKPVEEKYTELFKAVETNA